MTIVAIINIIRSIIFTSVSLLLPPRYAIFEINVFLFYFSDEKTNSNKISYKSNFMYSLYVYSYILCDTTKKCIYVTI